MSKLRAREKVVTTAQIENDGYHCCRWCKWCKNKGIDGFVCINSAYSGNFVVAAAQVAESGELSEALEEALHNVPEAEKEFLTSLTSLLSRYGLSTKRLEEFKKTFKECLDQYLDLELKQEIDEKVSILYSHVFSEFSPEGVVIKDPYTHYCREFW